MIASIKLQLLVATLGVSQFSGVFGAQGDFKEKRELLRRNLRSGSATADVKRNMQFLWEEDVKEESVVSAAEVQTVEDGEGYDDFFGPSVVSAAEVQTVEDGEGYDDFFGLSPEIQGIGESTEDDYFKSAATGNELAWDTAESRGVIHEEEEEDHDHDYYAPAKTTKFSKVTGGIDVSSNSKIQKAGKVGKMMWDEEPIMLKGDKKMKGLKSKSLKSLKSSKKDKSGKSDYEGRGGYYDSVDESHDDIMSGLFGDAVLSNANDDEEGGGSDWQSLFQSSGTGYGDIFSSAGAEDAVSSSDDFFDPMLTERADFEGDSETQGRYAYTFDDDYFKEDERLVFLPRPVVTLAGSVFSVNPQTVLPPVVPDGSGNTLTLGTEYLFNEVMTDAQNIDSQLVPIGVDSETVLFVIALDGYCDRIGPADQNSVQGYCFFTYTFIDPQTQLTAGAFTAQGIIVNADVPGKLTVTGGTGVMTGATGLVEILLAAVDQAINPPLLIQPPQGSDPFNGVAGWAHFFEFDVDVLFFLPELYA